GCALLDRPEAGCAARLHGVRDVEAQKTGRAVDPIARLHEIGEESEHAVRPRRQPGCLALEELVDVNPLARRLCPLELAESVTKPAHHQSTVEADALDHPAPGHRVAERPQAGLWVNQRLVKHESVLPETAADD